jgi:diketogulonate reductase-like aldo/keto reductase
MPHLISRRRFLQALSAFTAVANLPLAKAGPAKAAITKPIPSSGEQLPVIGMGSSRTFDVGESADERAPLQQVLQAFFDHGGALIDSSPMYGAAESVIGDLLKNVTNKEKLFAATKVWINGRQEGIDQMNTSAQRMGVKNFDLMQIHNLVDWETHLETLQDWKAAGKVRYIGITTSHGRYHGELEQILAKHQFDFVQFSYNIGNRSVEQRLLPLAAERGTATLINRPYQRGSLFRQVKGHKLPAWAGEFDCASWGQFFLKYVASHPAVTCVIPATSKVHHMVDNMGAGFGLLPDAKTRTKMEQYFASL